MPFEDLNEDQRRKVERKDDLLAEISKLTKRVLKEDFMYVLGWLRVLGGLLLLTSLRVPSHPSINSTTTHFPLPYHAPHSPIPFTARKPRSSARPPVPPRT